MISWYSSSRLNDPVPSLREHALRLVQGRGQRVHLVARVVEVHRGPRRRSQTEAPVQRLGAVIAGTDRDFFGVEYLCDVVGVHLFERERHYAASLFQVCWVEYAHCLDLKQTLQKIKNEPR